MTIEESLLPEYEACKIDGEDWVVMQDNCPVHTAAIVKERLKELEIPILEWPPYSPDLNPIENVWGYIKRILHSEYPVCRNAEEVEGVILQIWNSIPDAMIQKFAGNMEHMLRAVIEADGGHTKY